MSEMNTSARVAIGKVISDKMTNTVVVLVERKVRHQKYGKFMRRSSKLHAHDLMNAKVGDIVKVRESKPYSKTKTWELVEIVRN